jgi:hypothetical protein
MSQANAESDDSSRVWAAGSTPTSLPWTEWNSTCRLGRILKLI